MNANELADELWEKYLDNNECQHGYALSSGCSNDDCKEQALYDAANMLRQLGLAESIIKQQQLEIEALKKQLDTRTKELIGASFYEHDYKTMMANNEPVAWMLVDEINGDYMLERHPSGDYDWIPLYTHPVKELTDEEIMELWYPLDLHDEAWVEDSVLVNFARAILRKAQEK